MTTRYAIILAAGEGTRLRPLTETAPKCMIKVCGKSILENALNLFADKGVENVRVVIGHLASVVREQIGSPYKGMNIEFIENAEFATTNSMYSLHLGLSDLREATWILEGDVFFEPAVLAKTVRHEISWFVDALRKDLDGAYISFNDEHRAISLNIIRDLKLLTGQQGKSIGLLHLNSIGTEHFKKWLEQGVSAGQQNLYYDLIVGPHFGEASVEIVDVGGLKWFEIDNLTDLENANKLFA
ncbi:MAG: phosphocholine cytidylyltransferase family protein [Deltaproteobacteria bacterium]|nr:phosphocholine cytidylyltransferase family protein [Deltaproteobacteria bacterium]